MDASDPKAAPAAGTANSDGKKHKPPKPPETVVIVVNETRVSITKSEHTGLEIKQTAISQGAVLELDFVLSVQQGKHHVTLADNDVVKVRAGMDFLAVAGDDNS